MAEAPAERDEVAAAGPEAATGPGDPGLEGVPARPEPAQSTAADRGLPPAEVTGAADAPAAVDEPVVDEAAVDEATVDEPAVDEPAVDGAAVDGATVDGATVDEAGADETAALDAGTLGPAAPTGRRPAAWAGLRGRDWSGLAVTLVALLAILAGAAYFRYLGVDWDQGQHLHPDERFLTMVASAFGPPADFTGYMDTQTSTMNPRNTGHEFFVYGTWPISLAYLVGERLGLTGYDQIYLVGRKLSAFWDLLALALLFVLGTRLVDRRVGLLAALLGAATAFAIQQSHFFTVETATNLFVMIFLVGLVEAAVHRRDGFLAVAGVGLGMALASKISVWPLVVVALVALALAEQGRRGEPRRGAWRLALNVVFLGLVSFLTLRVADPTMFVGPGWPNVVENPDLYAQVVGPMACGSDDANVWCRLEALLPAALEPYLLPDPRWMKNVREVQNMVTGYGMDWPPNHQWWGRWPWLFPLQNIVLWGMGIPLGLMAVVGWSAAGFAIARRRTRLLIPWLWAGLLFFYLGMGWAKTMRYFFPIYPALIVLAAWALVASYDWARSGGPDRSRVEAALRRPALALGLIGLVVGGTLLWGTMVSRIYAADHSRVAASDWIYHHVPTAMGLTVVDGGPPGPYMPASHSSSLSFDGHAWTLPEGLASEPARVLVPGSEPVAVDGAMLARVFDPSGAGGRRSVKAWLTDQPARDPDGRPLGVLAEGQTSVTLTGETPQDIRVPLQPVTLAPQHTGLPGPEEPGLSLGARLLGSPAPEGTQKSEYYVWFQVDGGPVAGSLPVLGYETTWDDIVPLGMLGYAAFDNPDTSYGEGLYGAVNLDLYAEDDPNKVEALVTALEKADYLVSSSNRVYGSTAQLPSRYPLTNTFYERLFAGTAGFRRILDGHSFPRLGGFEVDDQPAEEAWHVYDHPRVLVFEKTPDFDPSALRALFAPLPETRTWVFPPRIEGPLAGLRSSLVAVTAGIRPVAAAVATGAEGADETKPLSAVMLGEARRLKQRADGTWTRLFDPDGLVNRYPALAVLWWYLLLAALGLAAWPMVAACLPNLADRGWAVSRAAGLLVLAWLSWLLASYELVRNTPALLWALFLALALLGAGLAWRRRQALVATLRRNWRLLAAEEALFAALFLVFLGIRLGNPDLWHPYFGGEKPMDFAYLNAVIRSAAFPPYDPWFAGGKLNYYYFGFVFVGALVKLSGVVPWLAYNLAIPSLAAMTGLGVFGLAYDWTRRFGRRPLEAGLAGLLGMVLAVISGNLYQVKFLLDKLAEQAPGQMESQVPGLALALNAGRGWLAVVQQSAYDQLLRLGADPAGALASLNTGASLASVPTHHWYWNASRAIPGDPITEFPFFTFLYADLHAHMMAMPIAILAFTVALSWASPTPEERRWATPVRLWQLGRLLIAALAIGALWPTNTWDFPTYGLVAAAGIAVGQWQRHGRPGWAWLASVAARGLPLLLLSLLLFWPYHASYVQPYGSFDPYRGARTELAPYLWVHGIFLYAILSWALVAFARAWRRPAERWRLTQSALATLVLAGGTLAYLWWTQAQRIGSGSADVPPPSPGVPLLATAMLVVGVPLVLRRRASGVDRLMAALFVLGVLLTQFVEVIVLRGDIGRMNTVFKFYIQVWLIWAALAGVAVAWLLPYVRGALWRRPAVAPSAALDGAAAALPEAERLGGATGWAAAGGEEDPGSAAGRESGEERAAAGEAPALPAPVPARAAGAPRGGTAWATGFGLLLLFGLLYPVTAARAKIQDRFPAQGPMTVEEREAYNAAVKPGLSGIAFEDYARYDDEGHVLRLAYDKDAIQWMLRNLPGTPTILEGFREAGYRWGARYSINTGLPTVIGWDWHQKQQRNAVGGGVVDQRTADVREIYNTADVARAEALLDQYHVDYVIVGEMERAFYDPAGIAKFEDMAREGRLEQVYPPDGAAETPVRIWRRAGAEASAP